MTDAATRSGTHPFDEALADTWLWQWILPSLQLLGRRWKQVLPVALAFGAYVWLLPHLLLSNPLQPSRVLELFDSLQTAFVGCAFVAVGYALLARAEGAAHGLGHLPERAGIARRLALVTLFWLGFGWLAGLLLRGLVALLAKSPSFLEFGMWCFAKLGWWAIPWGLWLFAPLFAWMATVSALTQVRAIRAEEALATIIGDSFRRVFADLLRLAIPAWAIGAALIGLLWIGAELLAKLLFDLYRALGSLSMVAMAAALFAWVPPFWFVLERVYLPELGVEDDVDVVDGSAEPPAPQAGLEEQLDAVKAEEGSAAAARRLANWVRGRLRPHAELAALMRRVGEPATVARELSAVAVEWVQVSKPGELPWLVGEGMTLHPAFLMDLPDQVMAVAKKLTIAERADLATRLLLTFLKQHQKHPAHLQVGLQLARLLATHQNNLAGARKLLGQLVEMYPDDPQPAQLLKQLGSA